MTLELQRHFTFYGNINFKNVLFPDISYCASLLDSDVSGVRVASASHFTWFVVLLQTVRDVTAPSGITLITCLEYIKRIVQSQNEEVTSGENYVLGNNAKYT